MHNKKYRLDKIEEMNKHNPIYENMDGATCYLAYLNVGDRGWFLFEDSWGLPHRIHTSTVRDVVYTDGQVLVTTMNTKFTFTVIGE